MKKLLPFLTLLLSFLLLGAPYVYAQSEQDSIKPVDESKLPSKKRVIDDSAYYSSNPYTDYNEAYYRVNRLNAVSYTHLTLPTTPYV